MHPLKSQHKPTSSIITAVQTRPNRFHLEPRSAAPSSSLLLDVLSETLDRRFAASARRHRGRTHAIWPQLDIAYLTPTGP
jgi:hypothetical protein